MPTSQSALRIPWPQFTLIAGVFYGTGYLASFTDLTLHVPTLWPGPGIALAAILLYGTPGLLPVGAASLVLNWQFLTRAPAAAPYSGAALLIALAITLVACLQAFVGAWLVRRFIGTRGFFERESHVGHFLLIALLISPLESSLRAYLLLVGGAIPQDAFLLCLGATCFSRLTGLIAFAPALLVGFQQERRPLSHDKLLEFAAFLLLFAVLALAIVHKTPDLGQAALPVALCLIPLHVWAVLRFGLRGAQCFLVLTTFVGFHGVKAGLLTWYDNDVTEEFFMVEAYLLWVSIAGMYFTSMLRRRNQMEEDLRTSMRSYREIFELASIGKVEIDPHSQRFLSVNRKFAEMLLYPREELLRLNINDVTYHEDLRVVAESMHQVMTSDHDEFVIKKRYRRKDGSIFWGMIHGSIVRDHAGRVKKLIGSIHDRTAFNEVESRLLLSETRNRLAVAAAALGTFEHDLHSDEISFCQQALKHFGIIHKRTVMADEFFAGIHDQDRDHVRRVFQGALPGDHVCLASENEPLPGDSEARAKVEFRFIGLDDGIERWIESNVRVVGDEDRLGKRLIGVNRDVTQHKLIDRSLREAKDVAETANRLKSQFLANMSHEIRTPVCAILGYSDFLLEPEASQDEKQVFVSIIKKYGSDLIKLIDDILELSKVESGHMRFDRQAFSLHELLTEMNALYSAKAAERGIFFGADSWHDLPVLIESDPTRLRQVINNLVGNALKFTPTGGQVIVEIYSHPQKIEVGRDFTLCFNVSDSGCGIAPEHHQLIFEPFAQADASTTRKYGGTGLGLVLARRLARALGGDVLLQASHPGVGSTFAAHVQVRCLEAALAPIKHLEQSTKERELLQSHIAALRTQKVLVVEDNLEIQNLICRYLRGAGMEVGLAANGEEALTQVSQHDFDLILMDIQMPVLDGYSATLRLRQQGYDCPIIALTSYAMQDERQKSLAVGCTAHLRKPFSKGELLSTLAFYAGPSSSCGSSSRGHLG